MPLKLLTMSIFLLCYVSIILHNNNNKTQTLFLIYISNLILEKLKQRASRQILLVSPFFLSKSKFSAIATTNQLWVQVFWYKKSLWWNRTLQWWNKKTFRNTRRKKSSSTIHGLFMAIKMSLSNKSKLNNYTV